MDRVSKIRYTSYLPEQMANDLKELSEKTRVPQAKLVEEAIGDLLEKYYGKFTTYQKKV